MHDDEIVEVYSVGDLGQAYFLRDLLADHGIEARVVGDRITTGLGFPPVGESAPCIWVHRRDELPARQFLAEWEKNNAKPHPDEDAPRPAWKCPACGELVEQDFEICWNCQTSRPPAMKRPEES